MIYVPRVLIVDDSPTVRSSIKQVFNGSDVEFIEASDGYMAVDLLEKSEKNEETIDLIVADMIMPGMNGLELLNEKNNMKNYLPFIPVLIITSSTSLELACETWKFNIADILFKPFSAEDIRKKVASMINALSNQDYPKEQHALVACVSNFQRTLFKKTLNKIRVEKVETVDQFKDAWSRLVTSGEKNYDLIITDWQIGNESCVDFLQKVRGHDRFSKIPVCITMSTLSPEKVKQLMSFPLVSILYKNINQEDLIFRIKYLHHLRNYSSTNGG